MSRPFSISRPHQQLAEELRNRIRAGEWEGRMPGLRRLMADFRASRTTVEGALAELLKSGDLKSKGPRAAYEPVKRERKPENEGTLLVHDTPVHMRGGEHREIFLGIEAALPAPVRHLSLPLESSDAFILGKILQTGIRRIAVLDHRGEIVDALVDAGKIVVALGVASRPEKAPAFGVAYETLVREAFRRAFAAGHRRVSFPIWRKQPETAQKIRSWIADEYSKAGYPHAVEFDAPVIADFSPHALHVCLREMIRHTPPTAIITSEFAQWLGTISVLGGAGLVIPRDVSVLCLCANVEWETVTPAPSHFRYPVRQLITHVTSALASLSRDKPVKGALLAPVWVAGASLSEPAKKTPAR